MYKLINLKTLSIFLIPISYIIILFYDSIIVNVSNLFIFIALAGCLDVYYVSKKNNYLLANIFHIFVSILHLILLYPLVNYKKYVKPNIIGFILSLIAILVIIYLPWWPYSVKRNTFITILIIINILSTLGWYFLI